MEIISLIMAVAIIVVAVMVVFLPGGRVVYEPLLTTEEAAVMLGITSTKTIENWLEGGEFPGAVKIRGKWRFPLGDVQDVANRIEVIRAKNASGDTSLPEDLSEHDF